MTNKYIYIEFLYNQITKKYVYMELYLLFTTQLNTNNITSSIPIT